MNTLPPYDKDKTIKRSFVINSANEKSKRKNDEITNNNVLSRIYNEFYILLSIALFQGRTSPERQQLQKDIFLRTSRICAGLVLVGYVLMTVFTLERWLSNLLHMGFMLLLLGFMVAILSLIASYILIPFYLRKSDTARYKAYIWMGVVLCFGLTPLLPVLGRIVYFMI